MAIQSYKMYARVTSPYALATMYVEGLKLDKFNPPISNILEPDANELMIALNELAKDIKSKQETIKKLENLRIEFVANVSHELKTPLTSIRGYTETLLSGAYKDSQTCQKFLKRIDENSERLNHLISDLLELSRLEAFPNEIEWSSFSSQAIIEKLEAVFFPVLNETKQKIFFKFSDAQIEGDRKKIEQVFVNLIDNAIRYTPPGTLIEVKQTKNQTHWVYEVKDNGPGISKEHLPRIFERFYRVDKARSVETGGTGLGLSIVKHIVLAHKGSIDVESDSGKGTRFLIKIPLNFGELK
ncbi:MAG: hypothetical protein IPM57_10300 [Oligoflexia bacterium]|nr:hypothetical protein [Oligoflexia bacterium]